MKQHIDTADVGTKPIDSADSDTTAIDTSIDEDWIWGSNAKIIFWQDVQFWLAMSLGPLCWLVLYFLNVPLHNGTFPWEALLWIALVYPILEEFVFRGLIQTTLLAQPRVSRSFTGISLSNIITSVLFAGMHLINQPPLWAALVFLPSLVFGWARERYGYIHASIVLHMFYNAGFVLIFATL